MKNASASASLLAVALGAASAAVTTALMLRSRATPEPIQAGPVLASVESATAELAARVAQLQRANEELRARLAGLELRPAPPPREPVGDFVALERFAAFEQEVRAWMLGAEPKATQPTGIAPAPELREEVAAALMTIRKDEAVAGAKKKNEWEASRLEERVEELSEWLSLDEYQRGEMRAILDTKDAQDLELIRMWEEGSDEGLLVETKLAHAEALHDELELVLGPQQLETFRAKFPRPARRDARD